MKTLITICARGGSKGIPGKNIKLLAGKPLITYSIETAKLFKATNKNVFVELSTDSEEIASVAAEYGLKTSYRRPSLLANDTIGKIDVLEDILRWSELKYQCKFDYLIDLDVTSPLRTLDDLKHAFNRLQNDTSAYNIFSVSPAGRSPYFNMVEKKENGYYRQVKSLDNVIMTRQSAPVVYDMNASFYIYRRSFFDNKMKSAITDYSLIYMMPHICFDLDHPIDFEIMSFLFENKKLDFIL